MVVRIIRDNEGGFMFELIDNIPQSAVIKVLGVGGGGGNGSVTGPWECGLWS